MMNLKPFLLFDGNCAEALTFYQACFGGTLTLTKVSETPMKSQFSSTQQSKVLHAHLECGILELVASDWMHPTRLPRSGNMVCLYLNGGTYTELRYYFDQLAEGGDASLKDDLQNLPFGSYGHLADKFGVHWFFQGDKNDNFE